MTEGYTPAFSPGTRVRIDQDPRHHDLPVVYGVVTDDPLQPGDDRTCIRTDSGARILYPNTRLNAAHPRKVNR